MGGLCGVKKTSGASFKNRGETMNYEMAVQEQK